MNSTSGKLGGSSAILFAILVRGTNMSSHIPRKRLAFAGLILLAALLSALFLSTTNLSKSSAAGMQVQSQGTCITFKETGQSLCSHFLEYWRTHGGLPQFGYPLSGEFSEKSDLNGNSYMVQYFERAVFEMHPENKPPYEVLLSQLGTLQFRRKYPQGVPTQAPFGTLDPGSPTPATKGSEVNIAPNVVATLIDEEQASVTGVHTRACGTEMTWVLQVTNRSAKPFTLNLDKSSLKMVDSTGKSYALSQACTSHPYSGSFAQPIVLVPGEVGKGYVAFDAANIPISAKYFDLSVVLSGTPVAFRYLLP